MVVLASPSGGRPIDREVAALSIFFDIKMHTLLTPVDRGIKYACYSFKEEAMTFPEAVEEILAIAIATYLDGQRRERLKEAIELSVRTLDEWDRTRLGISQEQLAALTAWAKTAPGEEGVTALRAEAAARERAAKEHA
jgi:hypothetical protein